MIKALVFDFDGVIMDTEEPAYECWRDVYREHGCDLPLAEWATGIGGGHGEALFDPYDYLARQIGRPIDREALRRRYWDAYLAALRREPARPGVEAYLAHARQLGLGLAIASSSPRQWVEGHLTRLGLIDRFDCLRCAEDVERRKPDPDLYLAALAGLGARAEEGIAFEDSPNGIASARRAGLFCVAVPNAVTARLDLGQADLLVPSLAELPLAELLERRSGDFEAPSPQPSPRGRGSQASPLPLGEAGRAPARPGEGSAPADSPSGAER